MGFAATNEAISGWVILGFPYTSDQTFDMTIVQKFSEYARLPGFQALTKKWDSNVIFVFILRYPRVEIINTQAT